MHQNDAKTHRPSIADGYRDLLAPLDDDYRRALVRRLARGFYEDWRPTRRELTALIAEETGQRSGNASDIRSSARSSTASSLRSSTGPSTRVGGSPQVIATFEVDCGQLAPHSRLVARCLSTAGIVRRGNEQCRLLFLHYELHRLLVPGQEQPLGGDVFTAPIICFPDHLVPWADSDGRDLHHAVSGDRIMGRRGPWPLSGQAQRVQFMINRQSPAGVTLPATPAGRLVVDIRSGRAAWRPA